MTKQKKEITISAQVTPNPDTLKFVVDKTIVDKGSFNYLIANNEKFKKMSQA